ncbi:MAG TPA: ArsA family ATPase [Solirubrobacteraceae bacterium]|nr:ArsA family ATPase [Solirubrobacteraceae bacterium]
MSSLLDRKLLFVTGKGGVGKTTMSCALALAAAAEGRRTIVVEVGEQSRLPTLFGVKAPSPGTIAELRDGVSSISIDPDRALLEWLQALGGRVPGRVLASSSTFSYFAAAAPGAKELVSMVKIWQLTRGAHKRRGGYDLVVVDAPATGHALGMLGSPGTFGAIARIGPIAGQTRQLQELLRDERRTGYVGVALGTEMAVTEAIELQDGLERELQRRLSAVIVNSLLPRRFSAREMEQIEALADGGRALRRWSGAPERRSSRAELRDAALAAARTVHDRARFQHNQLARLRRRRFDVIAIPFVWEARLQLEGIGKIAERLAAHVE